MGPSRRFGRDAGGVTSIEFALIAPTIAALLFGCFCLFFLYRGSYQAETATFTVADILSRQTTVTDPSLKTVHAMFQKMVPDAANGGTFRVSSIRMANKTLSVEWSYAVAPTPVLTPATIPVAKMPLIAEGDTALLVETSVIDIPIADILGLGAGRHDYIAINRPRFTAAIVKTD